MILIASLDFIDELIAKKKLRPNLFARRWVQCRCNVPKLWEEPVQIPRYNKPGLMTGRRASVIICQQFEDWAIKVIIK